MVHRKKSLCSIVAVALGTAFSVQVDSVLAQSTVKEITLIHMGDVHGHLYPRPNVRSDGIGRMEGGLARLKTKIDQIRSSEPYNLLINTGDTTQGSGEALYTRGKALVDVLDLFKIDVFAPGNWDFVYGKDRFVEHFAIPATATTPVKSKRWGALAGNVYNDTNANGKVDAGETSVLPGTLFKMLNGVKVGVIGCTTNRGPQAVGNWVNDGLAYTDCANEVKASAAAFRSPTRPSSGTGDPGGAVDIIVLASEIEIGRNIQLLKELDATNHVDVVLNSDMHEELPSPLIVTTAAGFTSRILEQGMDGTAVGKLELEIKPSNLVGQKIVDAEYRFYRIDDSLSENSTVKSKVAAVSKPYLKAGYVKPASCTSSSIYWNMFSETCLHGPLDVQVGVADIALHRSNFDDEPVPAALEGTSHNWIADAIRWWARSDAATVRGFRYGTTVKGGSITRNDLFHFVPIGPRVAKVSRITAVQLRNQVDNSSRSTFGSDPAIDWRGGWLFAYSADDFSLKFDPYSVSSASNPVDWNATNGNAYYNPATYTNAGLADPFAAVRKPSRARDLTVRVPCVGLPAAERSGCTDSAVTHITNNTDGDWTPAWNTAFAAQTIYNLAPGNGTTEVPWKLTAVSVTKPFQVPAMSAAGYWYRKTPQTLNNCENCFPSGISSDKTLSVDTPYLLPVNADTNGNPMVDAAGIPLVKVYAAGDTIPDGFKVGDWIPGADGKPQSLGRIIDLVEILEKYLKVRNANPTTGRVTLWNGATLPDRTLFGFPVIQPLCGTLGRTSTTACP